jgi:hypothetical protein
MTDSLQPQFTEVLTLIQTAQRKVIATTNQELIKLYWSIGKYISDRMSTAEWGQKTIEQLATFIPQYRTKTSEPRFFVGGGETRPTKNLGSEEVLIFCPVLSLHSNSGTRYQRF